jgi:hypothetical protein
VTFPSGNPAPPGTYEYVRLFHVNTFDLRGTIAVTPWGS